MVGEGARIDDRTRLLAGTVARWTGHLERIAGVGPNGVHPNPCHDPGFSGGVYVVTDRFRLDPLSRGGSRMSTNRPQWLRVPLAGLARLLAAGEGESRGN